MAATVMLWGADLAASEPLTAALEQRGYRVDAWRCEASPGELGDGCEPDVIVVGDEVRLEAACALCRQVKLSRVLNRVGLIVFRPQDWGGPCRNRMCVRPDLHVAQAPAPGVVTKRVDQVLSVARRRQGTSVRFAADVTIPSRMSALAEAGDLLTDMLRRCGIDLQDVAKVRYCVAEMGLNAIEWGNKWVDNAIVRFTIQVMADRLCVTVADEGEGFDPGRLSHAAALGNPIGHVSRRRKAGMRFGGYGIMVCRQFLDEVVYNAKGNEVTLVKHFRQAIGTDKT